MINLGEFKIPVSEITWFDTIRLNFDDNKDFLCLDLFYNNEKIDERVIGIKQHKEG